MRRSRELKTVGVQFEEISLHPTSKCVGLVERESITGFLIGGEVPGQ